MFWISWPPNQRRCCGSGTPAASFLKRRPGSEWIATSLLLNFFSNCSFNSAVVLSTDLLERWGIMKLACAPSHRLQFKSYLSISCPLFSGDRLPLYQALFTSFRRCHTERRVPVILPGVMMKGQAQVQVTLHHHVCVHLCASVAALSSAFLPTLVGDQYVSLIGTRLHMLDSCGGSASCEARTYLLQWIVVCVICHRQCLWADLHSTSKNWFHFQEVT